ncbi:MAG: leucyl aminopeptidase [Actinomycetota bacterium]|nr:leucyl aminopeptidase [Actinomycetota bacterium]
MPTTAASPRRARSTSATGLPTSGAPVELTVSERSVTTLSVQALVVGLRGGDDGPLVTSAVDLPPEAVAHLQGAARELGATGRLEELTRVTSVPGVRAGTVVLVGLGEEPHHEPVRRAVGAALRSLSGRASAAVCAPAPELVAATAEGAVLGAYAVPRVTSTGSVPKRVPAVTVLAPAARSLAVRTAVARAAALGEGVSWCRDLVNAPPNLLHPQSFAQEVRDRFVGTGVRVKVLDERQLEHGGFGGIVGVGQGSARPPRLVVLTWRPRGAPQDLPSIALVGKGITFDSGGLSIKPRASMPAMKSDMSGAAAVAGAVLTAARLKLPVAVTAYLALAENMPDANAQRAGDVVTMRDGTTVEVLDPDAEGRMVLADAMALASESHPDLMLDVATLTGAQVLALDRVGAAMGNDDAFRVQVCDAAQEAGEDLWPMPLPAYLRAQLDSPFADLAHKGDANGGMLTAGLFLREFVGTTRAGEPIPWVHLDIAGPAYHSGGTYGYTPKGGTGYGVRTLVTLLEGVGG